MQINLNSYSTKFKIIVAIVVLVFVLWYFSLFPWGSKKVHRANTSDEQEPFVDTTKTVNNTIPIDYKQDDIDIIQPPLYDAYGQSIQSGSLFIPQPEYYNTQGEKVILGDVNEPSYTNPTGLGDNGLNFNMCSKSCCSDQWPVPLKCLLIK
jgi:hypothetical protein